VKDLPDLALLPTVGPLDAQSVRAAIEQTFAFRRTHPTPAAVPDPPDAWERPYSRMAEENALPWRTLETVTVAAKAFLDPVLADDASGTTSRWSPSSWRWS
jgi:hypothetical protein